MLVLFGRLKELKSAGVSMNPDTDKIKKVIENWLAMRLDPAAAAWVRDRQGVIRLGDQKGLYLAFGLAPRKVGKSDLGLIEDELSAASEARPGWNPRGWSVDQLTRALFLLSLPAMEAPELVAVLDQLFGAGEVGELVAMYQTLPLLPHPAAHVLRAAEGIRTNIKSVFCAVAHQNPYPAEQFSDDQWNQMVLKCQFIGVPMSPIAGLDQRANPQLSVMVLDFIHERWAAKRPIAPEMWRCVGHCTDARALADLKQVLASGSTVERKAVALTLSQSRDPVAKNILETVPDLVEEISNGTLTWATIDSISSM
jgi:hypothetical protein